MDTTAEKKTATFTHLSTLSQYIIPFGNYIFPILIWTSNKDKSKFVDFHGKQTLNFQLSLFLYTLALAFVAIPIFVFAFFNSTRFEDLENNTNFVFDNLRLENSVGIIIVGFIAVLLIILLKLSEFFLIIYASVKASKGEKYNYPLTINFIK